MAETVTPRFLWRIVTIGAVFAAVAIGHDLYVINYLDALPPDLLRFNGPYWYWTWFNVIRVLSRFV